MLYETQLGSGIPLHPDLNRNSEVRTTVSWNDFVDASYVFANDLELVRHPHTPRISPFSPINPNSHGQRQYNLVQIPPDMSEDEFLFNFSQRSVLKVGCMDRDASGPFYELLPPEAQRNITQLLLAGGGVQLRPERTRALGTMMRYLAINGQHLEQVFVTGHNHKCGYVAWELGGQAIPDHLGIPPCSDPENTAMKHLLLKTAEQIGLNSLFPKEKIVYGLEDIDRKGNVMLDTEAFHAVDVHNYPEAVQILTQFGHQC